MIDERFAASISAWLRRTDGPSRQPEVNVGRAMAQIRESRYARLGRRWPGFRPDRKPIEERRNEIYADAWLHEPAGGGAPVQIRGTITMLNPVKIIAAAAVLALSVGIASSGLLTTEPDAPGAGEAGASEVAPVWTGDYFDSDEGLVAVSGSARFGPSPGVVTGTVTMSDPRVSGEMLAGYQWLCEPNETCTSWGSATLTNDGGTWEGDFVAFNGPAPGHLQNLMIWMNGTGEYEGLSHVVNFVGPMIDSVGTGQIIDAPLPPQVALDWAADIAD